MPTAASSTEVAAVGRPWSEVRRAVADVGPLLRFRGSALRGRARPVVTAALSVVAGLTVVSAWLPAYLPGAAGGVGGMPVPSEDILLLLPTAYLGVMVIAIVSAASSGGGRELLPRDQAVAFPVSPTTDHLGALLMAPLNIAWLIQSWTVLAATAYVVGPQRLLAAQVPALLWLAVATGLAQAVAWTAEWVRRGPHGVWVLRATVAVLVGAVAALIATDRMIPLLDRAPTVRVVIAVLDGSAGRWLPWSLAILLLVVLGLLSVACGALMCQAMATRPARDEMRVETSTHPARANPGSDLLAMMRVDRAGVWRAVPLRRGFTVLALLPGLVALASSLDWSMLSILPGLVGSGGALLFGVNTWCLDGRGALWRDSLPVPPATAFLSRVLVLVEVLLVVTGLSLVLSTPRAGAPTAAELSAVLCAAVVVTFQVVSGSMRWSVHRPYTVDMRSARATPAPPLSMVGYSTRLALATTFTGMVFVATAAGPDWRWSLLVAIPLLLVSFLRLLRVADAWEDPDVRSRVVTTVSG